MSTTDTPIYDAMRDEYLEAGLGVRFLRSESLEQALTRIGHPQVYPAVLTTNPDYRDWSFINGIPVIRRAA